MRMRAMKLMSANDNNGPLRWQVLAFWLAVVLAVGLIGSWVTLPKIPVWYEALAKPGFTPPNWLFGPVWTLLYVLMAFAVWRAGSRGHAAARHFAIALFVVQLALNAIWSPVFFGLEAPLTALFVIVTLDIFVAATLIAFWRLDRPAGIMLVPYLAWVCYATALNAAIATMN
jgi:tryptophan-rich sensory protein